MICKRCGSPVPDGNMFCGKCGLPVAPAQNDVPYVEAVQLNNNDNNTVKKKLFKAPGKASRSYAAIMSALMLFPATFCIAMDLAVTGKADWSLYVLGALLTSWVILVFPALKITPAPITALVCFFAIICYITYVAGSTGYANKSIYQIGLPLMILAAIFVSIDSALISSNKFNGIHLFSLVLIEASLYLMAIEITLDIFHNKTVDIRWSAIFAGFFISFVALVEAINYVFKINSRK